MKASIAHDMPFVLLSDKFEGNIIGKCFEPNLDQVGKKSPIYFLNDDVKKKMLLHKSQIYAATHLQKNGVIVRKFEPLPAAKKSEPVTIAE